MAKDTKHFKVAEFACKCGCGFNIIDQRIMDMAEIIRLALGVPVHVNSGCRCKKHNAAVGGTDGSFHTKGLAADLSCSLGAKKLFAVVADLKARGKLPDLEYAILYIKKDFVHIDCGKKRNIFFEVRP
jgi:uncharacterized protein YcbK (DUF882 family)